MSDSTQLLEAVDKVAKSFEQFKETNDQMIVEERKGNEARAKELAESLEKISADLVDSQKTRDLIQKRLEMQGDRLEMLEALNDRPKMSIQDRLRDEHKALFERWVRSGGRDRGAEQAAEELHTKAMEVKDVSIGTSSAGGFAVPEEIRNEIDRILLKTSGITQHVRNVQVGTSDYKELVSVNDAGYAWAAETTDRSANTTTPALRERTPTWGELYAHPRTTIWAMQDMSFPVQNWLVENVTEAWSVGLSSAIWNGNGSSKPTGFINEAPTTADDGNEASPQRDASAFQYVPIQGANSSPFTTVGIDVDDIVTLIYKLNPRLRDNARFAMNTITQGHVMKLKDSDGQYLWQPSVQVGQPDRLRGYEVFTWEEMGNPTTADAYPVAFGDFMKAYTLVTRQDMNILVDPYTTKGYVAFMIARRFGGIVTNNSAVKLLKVALT